jgi:UDP-2,3-diacylglucosamine pyrophosphatase LpxH
MLAGGSAAAPARCGAPALLRHEIAARTVSQLGRRNPLRLASRFSKNLPGSVKKTTQVRSRLVKTGQWNRAMTAAMSSERLTVRTVWLSDIHLGSKDCRAQYLLDFLQRVDCEMLYLLGDIVDFWALRRQLLWPAAHYEVLRLIMHKAKCGTRVIYVPGNHDEVMREFIGHNFGPVQILRETSHVTADGRHLLLFHGDCLDLHVHLDGLSRLVGDASYDALMWLHRWVSRGRRLCGLRYWSLANYVKTRVGNARAAIDAFEHAALAEARRRGLDGVVCGHIHHPDIAVRDGLIYCNDGDWVESCTALVEDRNGALEILHWSDFYQSVKQLQAGDIAAPPLALRTR